MIANYFPSFITGAEPQIEFYTDTAEHFSGSWNDFRAVVERNSDAYENDLINSCSKLLTKAFSRFSMERERKGLYSVIAVLRFEEVNLVRIEVTHGAYAVYIVTSSRGFFDYNLYLQSFRSRTSLVVLFLLYNYWLKKQFR